MLKFCNHCHRLYDSEKGCSCKKEKREYQHDNFYDTPAWRTLSRYIRTRDFNLDRLQLYFMRKGKQEQNKAYMSLYNFCIDANNQPRKFTGSLLVHHIVPREEEPKLAYKENNLITLNTHTHEYVHQLYTTENKQDVQTILKSAVRCILP